MIRLLLLPFLALALFACSPSSPVASASPTPSSSSSPASTPNSHAQPSPNGNHITPPPASPAPRPSSKPGFTSAPQSPSPDSFIGPPPLPSVSSLPADVSCQQQGSVSSPSNTSSPTSFTVTNHTTSALVLFVIDSSGHAQSVAPLDAGRSLSQNSFVGYIWGITGPTNSCVRIFTITPNLVVTIS